MDENFKIVNRKEFRKFVIFVIEGLARNGMLKFVDDSVYVKLMFFLKKGRKLNLKNPKTFNEKIQWLKVNDHNLEYTEYVDKVRAKTKVAKLIGEEYIVPIIEKWDSVEKIKFNDLPNRYVLKCNHDQGSVVLVHNKEKLDIEKTKKFLREHLKKNNYNGTREYPYKNIQPCVFAEKYLGESIIDYKFYCFNGKPLFLYVAQGLTTDHSLKIDFYNMAWEPMPFYRTDYERLGKMACPQNFEKMKNIAEKLAKDVPFVRIDLFEVENKVYFSEFTLYPASGFMPFVPEKYDEIVGEWLKI